MTCGGSSRHGTGNRQATLDNRVAGDEIRIRSDSNHRVHRVYPRSGSMVAE